MFDAAALAGTLDAEHRAGRPFRPFSPGDGLTSLDGAYDVQDRYVAIRRQASRASVAGYKVGLTSVRMQTMCGIGQPIAGVVLADRVHASGVTLRPADYGRLGLEFEIGVRIGATLVARRAPFDRATVAGAVAAICPAVEVVDDRRADYSALDVLTLVADNSWNAGAVLGAFVDAPADLPGVVGIVRRDSVEEARGTGADVLGDPLEPVRWLANHLAARGQALAAGDLVLTGSLARTVFPSAPTRYDFELAGIGAVGVVVGP